MRNFCSLEQRKMLHDISTVDFIVVEMAEYLDTHPQDSKAIDFFNHYTRLKNQLTKDYAAKYAPLTLATADGYSKEWKWGLQPNPWEGELY